MLIQPQSPFSHEKFYSILRNKLFLLVFRLEKLEKIRKIRSTSEEIADECFTNSVSDS